MVYLFVDDFDVVSDLEKALRRKGIKFGVVLDIFVWGLQPPYIWVDGVPLDEERAWKWLKEN